MRDNVQTENGYTAIAHEILEQLAQTKLSPTQYRLILIIWRYTYGFKRKEHKMALSFLSKAIKCEKRHIQRELKELEERRIIYQRIEGPDRIIGFNKHYSQWVVKIDIGNLDNGEIDNVNYNNGKTDNGENIKGILVEQTTPPIVQTDNQEIKDLKTNLKTNNPTTTTDPPKPPELNFGDVSKAWESNFGLTISKTAADDLKAWNEQDGVSYELLIEAIKEAARSGVRNMNYISGILRDWQEKGITNLAGVEAEKTKWIQQNSRDKPRSRNDKNSSKVVDINGGSARNKGDTQYRDGNSQKSESEYPIGGIG